jgi:hypothetical protein
MIVDDGETTDPDLEEPAYRLELEAVYRGWQHAWTWDFTARYFLVDPHFTRLVFDALDRRWPGAAKTGNYNRSASANFQAKKA